MPEISGYTQSLLGLGAFICIAIPVLIAIAFFHGGNGESSS
jgi:hypothetical protein